MANNVQASSSGHKRLFEQKRNSNLQKNVSQYNERYKNESTSNSANLPDQMLMNSQDLKVEQLKGNELMKPGSIVQQHNTEQQKRNGRAETSYLNEEGYVKQRGQIRRKKSLEPTRNKEKEDGHCLDNRAELSPVAKSVNVKNGKYYVFTSCNRETCSKNVTENNLNTEKLTEIINNSIKEAMQSMVKETPNIFRIKQNSLLLNEQPLLSSNNSKELEKKREKSEDQIKKLVKENRSIGALNGFHIKHDPLSINTSNVNENQRTSHDMNFIKNNVTTANHTVDKCNKITCPYLTEKLEAKPNRIEKSIKSFKKPLMHSTATDNRRMTGNVNIYICSEASNEKEKQKSRESGSVTATETNMKASVSTISSNKLITNLLERRRRLQESSRCLCRKSETVLESRVEEIPREENRLSDLVTDSNVPPALDPVSNYETGIINTDHENDMEKFEKSNTNFDHFNNNGGDHSCTVQNCPYLKGRSVRHRNYIKNNCPTNVKWCSKNNSTIPSSIVDCDCSCAKTICPYLFRNGSVTSVKRFDEDKRNNNNKWKNRFDSKWQESEIQEVCIYCAPRRNKKVEQCSRKKLNRILKKCIKGTKQKEPLFKNFGTSQRRNCAEQCSISKSILKEEIEVNNINLNEEELLERIDLQSKEVYVASSYSKSEKASVDKLNVKDDVTMLPAKSELEKSSLLLSSVNYETNYQDEPTGKIGSEAHLSDDKDQSKQKYISNTKFVSPIVASPMVSDKRLDAVTAQQVKSTLKSVGESAIIEENKLTSSIASAPLSKIEKIAEIEEEEKEELDNKIEENLESKENQKESFFRRVVKRVKQLIGLSNVTDNMNDKRRRGCGSSCRALPRNFVNDEDVEDRLTNEDVKEYHQPVVSASTVKSQKEEIETTQETILTRQSSKDVTIIRDKTKDDEYKVESTKDVFNINKENASKAKLRRLIAKKKVLQQSNRNKYTRESKEIKINKDTLETQEDTQNVTSAAKATESKSSKATIESITDPTEGSRTIKEYDSANSKNLQGIRSLQSFGKTGAKESQIIKDTKNFVVNGKEMETQKSLTNSPGTIIGKNSKNLNSPKVSSNFNITKESVNLHVLEDPEKSVLSKNEDYSVNHVKSTKNSESDSIEDDSTYHPYTEYIQSKEAQKMKLVCNCRESENDSRICIICCCPEDNCSCNNLNNVKTMIRVNQTNSTYGDNPRERCTCQNTVCNCFLRNITKNNCNCNCDSITDATSCSCNKNNTVSVQDNDNMIYIAAWTPEKNIEKYFSRTLEDFKDRPKECCCFDNKKPRGSEELPYQRLGVFSKVMTELREKIKESVACKKCKNAPCCCVINETQTIIKKVTENKTKSLDQPRSQNRSPSSCKCILNTCESLSWKTSSSKIKNRHKPTPCYCRYSRSAQCRSRAKCFYCKCSPCRCTRSRETSRSRSCRCDSSLCRNADVSLCKMTATHPKISKNFPCPCTTSREPCSF